MRGDFHMHTTFSDGKLSVEELLSYAKNKGLDYISITDHDLLDGSIKANEIAKNYNLNAIVGFEFSTIYKDESIHILSYFSKLDKIDKLLSFLNKQRELRLSRAYEIKERLLKYFNIDLNMENLIKIPSITRGSIAREIINQGYNYSNQEIFSKMIGDDCKAYVPSTKIKTDFAIKLVKEAGGLAVLAHPVLLKKVSPEEIIEFGIDGIEAIYPKNKEGDNLRFINLAKKNNLFITAGSDFHYLNDSKHGDVGQVYLEGTNLDIFLKKLGLI